MCTRIDCQVISSRYSLATFQSPSWHLFHPLTKNRGQYFGQRFGRPSKNSFIKLKRNGTCINPTIFNIIHWVAGMNDSSTKHLLFQVLFLSSPIACVACERTELLKTEIVVIQNGCHFPLRSIQIEF